MHRLFFTGTDTEIGKTYVAALVARELVAAGQRVGVYKPVASGCRRVNGELVSDDALALWEAAGRPLSLDAVCPQRFEAPLAPPVAARAEGRSVDDHLLVHGAERWRGECDVLLVEGAGGLMSPLGETMYNADLAVDMRAPLVVVAPNRLGVINYVITTLLAASAYRGGLPVAGVVLNDAGAAADSSTETNAAEIARRAPLLASVAHGGGFDRQVDWLRLASAAATLSD